MGHNHTHQHNHDHSIASLNKAFMIGIILNTLFVTIEFGAGFYFDSLGLISDAGHNLSDVASLILALIAFRLSKVKANSRYTYGYKKSTVLVSLLNAVILLVAVGIIISESIDKITNPQPLEGGAIAWVAGIGVLINALTAMLFIKNKEKDINIKGAYLHMAADALVSVGVLISGIVIANTSWYVIDPIIGIVIALVILISTWGLLRQSLRLSLDGVPIGLNYKEVESIIEKTKGVSQVHHLHIWAISTTENALTAHVVISHFAEMESLKYQIKEQLHKVGITHATIEFENTKSYCKENECE